MKQKKEEEDDIPYKYGFFHLVFSLGAMYFAMLFISWDLNNSPTKNMDNSDGSHSDEPEPIVKRVRGSTKMGALVARHEQQRERLHVDFDANKNPIGDEEDKFISYIGYLA
ncbi:hypothetical protein K1719_037412 [Acacia pycnantha]|nr:hypothetical protein K1719_037412 [Acacia pycnantha]